MNSGRAIYNFARVISPAHHAKACILCHFLDTSHLMKTAIPLPTFKRHWSSKHMHQEEKYVVTASAISLQWLCLNQN